MPVRSRSISAICKVSTGGSSSFGKMRAACRIRTIRSAGVGREAAEDAKTRDATIEYSKRLAAIRRGGEFAMCAKGWIQLRWSTESEPHGSFVLGERTHEFVANRLRERQPRWDYINARWIANYPVAVRFYSKMREATSAPMTVVGLIEDGMFEERIQVSAALLGEMLWNPNRDEKAVLDAALSPYYGIVE